MEQLEAIWKAVVSVFESLQLKLFEFVLELIDELPTEQMDFFYEKILEMDVDKYNNQVGCACGHALHVMLSVRAPSQVLTFITDFTRKAVQVRMHRDESSDDKLYGLDIFWNVLIKSTPNASNEAALNETCQHLQQLLSEFPRHRALFIERCLANLKEGKIIVISLKLLMVAPARISQSRAVNAHRVHAQDIMQTFGDLELSYRIEQLNEKYALVDTIVQYVSASCGCGLLCVIVKRCVPRRNARLCKELDDGEEAVNHHLNTLEFLVTQSELSLTGDAAAQLWDNLVFAGYGVGLRCAPLRAASLTACRCFPGCSSAVVLEHQLRRKDGGPLHGRNLLSGLWQGRRGEALCGEDCSRGGCAVLHAWGAHSSNAALLARPAVTCLPRACVSSATSSCSSTRARRRSASRWAASSR